MKTILMLLASLVIASNSLASGGTNAGKIQYMYIHDGKIHVKIKGVSYNEENNHDKCKKTDYFAIEKEDKDYEAMHAMLLAAQMSGKEVSLWVNGCAGQHGSYPHIVSVWLRTP